MSRPKIVGLSLLVLSGMFLLAGNVMAQNENVAGPFDFDLTVRGAYTDNRDSAPDGLEEDNIDVFVTPRVHALHENETTLVDFFYAPSWRWRDEPSVIQNENEWQHALGLNLDHQFSDRFEAKVRENLNFTDDPSVEVDGSTLRRDSSFLLNRAGLSGIYRFDRRNSIEASGQYDVKRYDNSDVADQSDEDRASAALNYWRQISPQNAVFAEARGAMYQYSSVADVNRDFDAVYGILGAERMFNPQTRGGLHAGMSSAEYDSDAIDSDTQPYGKAYLQSQLSPSTFLYTEASYMLRDSDVYPFASQNQTLFYATLDWDATEHVRLGAKGSYHMGDYEAEKLLLPEGKTTEYDSEGQEDRIRLVGEVTYKFDDWTSLKLAQSYEDVDSDVSVSFTRNETSLALSRQF